MSPEIVAKLHEDVPEFKALIKYLSGKALELNNLADIKSTAATDIAVEVLARQRAHAKIVEILGDLYTVDKPASAAGANKDFVV